MTPFSFLSALRASPFLGILRDVEQSHLPSIAEVARKSQLGFIEITMNTAGAGKLIRSLADLCAQYEIQVGAGTVRTLEDLDVALDAGAKFIVSPCTDENIILQCAKLEVPCLPGA